MIFAFKNGGHIYRCSVKCSNFKMSPCRFRKKVQVGHMDSLYWPTKWLLFESTLRGRHCSAITDCSILSQDEIHLSQHVNILNLVLFHRFGGWSVVIQQVIPRFLLTQRHTASSMEGTAMSFYIPTPKEKSFTPGTPHRSWQFPEGESNHTQK